MPSDHLVLPARHVLDPKAAICAGYGIIRVLHWQEIGLLPSMVVAPKGKEGALLLLVEDDILFACGALLREHDVEHLSGGAQIQDVLVVLHALIGFAVVGGVPHTRHIESVRE